MAFSTQNQFFDIPFLREFTYKRLCRTATINTRTYDSKIGDRNSQQKVVKQRIPKLHSSNRQVIKENSPVRSFHNIRYSKTKMFNENCEDTNTLKEELCGDIISTFFFKIKKLIAAGILNCNEKVEFENVYSYIKNLNNAYSNIVEENAYLKSLVEKFTQFNNSPVNCLFSQNPTFDKSQEIRNLNIIIEERNSLRHKLRSFCSVDEIVNNLHTKIANTRETSKNLSNNLTKQVKYIHELENELKQMQCYYEDKVNKSKFDEEALKIEFEDLKKKYMQNIKDSNYMQILQTELEYLRDELVYRNAALSDYECQYKKLIDVVDELRCKSHKTIQDMETQTCAESMDDLAFYANITIKEINKILNGQRNYGSRFHLDPSFHNYNVTGNLDVLNDKIQPNYLIGLLTEENDSIRDELAKCKQTNSNLKEKLSNHFAALETLSERISVVDSLIKAGGQDNLTKKENLMDSLDLVQDIKDLQTKNGKLSQALNAFTPDGINKGHIFEEISEKQPLSDSNYSKHKLDSRAELTSNKEPFQNKDPTLILDKDPDWNSLNMNSGNKRDSEVTGGYIRKDDINENNRITKLPTKFDTETLLRKDISDIMETKKNYDNANAVKEVSPQKIITAKSAQDFDNSTALNNGLPSKTNNMGEISVIEKVSQNPTLQEDKTLKETDIRNLENSPYNLSENVVDDKPKTDLKILKKEEAFKNVSNELLPHSSIANLTDNKPQDSIIESNNMPPQNNLKDTKNKSEPNKPDDPIQLKNKIKQQATMNTGEPKEHKNEANQPETMNTEDPKQYKNAVKQPETMNTEDPKQYKNAVKHPETMNTEDSKQYKNAVNQPETINTEDPKQYKNEAKQSAKMNIEGIDGAKSDIELQQKTDKPNTSTNLQKSKDPKFISNDVDNVNINSDSNNKYIKENSKLDDSPNTTKLAKQEYKPQDNNKREGIPKSLEYSPSKSTVIPDSRKTQDTTQNKTITTGMPSSADFSKGKEESPDTTQNKLTKNAPQDFVKPSKSLNEISKPEYSSQLNDATQNKLKTDFKQNDPRRSSVNIFGSQEDLTSLAKDATAVIQSASLDRDLKGNTFKNNMADGTKGSVSSKGIEKLEDLESNILSKSQLLTSDKNKQLKADMYSEGTANMNKKSYNTATTNGQKNKYKPNVELKKLDPYEEFIKNNATEMGIKLSSGGKIVNELRSVLDTFIQECSFCFFCNTNLRKCRFYFLCHKILHQGIQSLAFKEILHMHKKLYYAAEKLNPGHLYHLILKDHKVQNENVKKCCTCRNYLCCTTSENMLKEKISKLERDIKQAKEYLDNLRQIPGIRNEYTLERHFDEDSRNKIQDLNFKQIKNVKSRIFRYAQMLH